MAAAASGDEHIETLDGDVVDIACVRKYARSSLAERAREHTRECALMGHCVESGYALVAVNGQVALLDSEATPIVLGRQGGSRSPHWLARGTPLHDEEAPPGGINMSKLEESKGTRDEVTALAGRSVGPGA